MVDVGYKDMNCCSRIYGRKFCVGSFSHALRLLDESFSSGFLSLLYNLPNQVLSFYKRMIHFEAQRPWSMLCLLAAPRPPCPPCNSTIYQHSTPYHQSLKSRRPKWPEGPSICPPISSLSFLQ